VKPIKTEKQLRQSHLQFPGDQTTKTMKRITRMTSKKQWKSGVEAGRFQLLLSVSASAAKHAR